MPIRGVHTMFYSDQATALREFLRDKLGLPCTDTDGQGWLIFDLPEADMGVHPTDEGGSPHGTHAISFYCDDVEATVGELKENGVEFTMPIEDHGWGFVTAFKAPGDVTFQLYQPKYRK